MQSRSDFSREQNGKRDNDHDFKRLSRAGKKYFCKLEAIKKKLKEKAMTDFLLFSQTHWHCIVPIGFIVAGYFLLRKKPQKETQWQTKQ
jgi:hypothetical protein